MSDLRIGCSPITGTIFAGRLNKKGNLWVGKKTDVTTDVLHSVLKKVIEFGEENTLIVTIDESISYEIRVTEIQKETK